MPRAAERPEFPSLFSHTKRAEWGVGVLSGERDGKRSYLFEDGEERVLGAGGIELMRKVDHPNDDQQASCARLLNLLAKREGSEANAEAPGAAALIKQLQRLDKKFHGGFLGKEWRTDEQNMFARKARARIVPKTQAQLSAESLEPLADAVSGDTVWGRVVALLTESELATSQLRQPAAKDQHKLLAEATRDLLHGTESHERRFDRFVSTYAAVFGEPPSWQTITALPALMSPVDQIYVEPTSFRKQLKALARTGAFVARPNGAAYARCLSMAQTVAHMLAARGAVPRDLLDVHDFIRATV